MYSSLIEASLEEQSASLPGKELTSSAPLRRVSSRALRAASRARAACSPFPQCDGIRKDSPPGTPAASRQTRIRQSPAPRCCRAWSWSVPQTAAPGILTEIIAVKSFTHVIPGQSYSVIVLDYTAFAGVVIDNPGQCTLEIPIHVFRPHAC